MWLQNDRWMCTYNGQVLFCQFLLVRYVLRYTLSVATICDCFHYKQETGRHIGLLRVLQVALLGSVFQQALVCSGRQVQLLLGDVVICEMLV